MFTTEKARAKMGCAYPKPAAKSGRPERVKSSVTGTSCPDVALFRCVTLGLIDLDRLRHVPLMKVAVGRCPDTGAWRQNRPSLVSRMRRAKPRRGGYLRLCSISFIKIIPNAFRERAVLKLMFSAFTRAAECWRSVKVTEFERNQMAAVRKELVQEYEAMVDLNAMPSKDAAQVRISRGNPA
jgi:hypothetical protein